MWRVQKIVGGQKIVGESEDCGGVRRLWWGQKIVEGELGKGSSAQWLAQAGKPRTPRVVDNFHPLILCILGFCFLLVSIMPSGIKYTMLRH